MKKWNVWQCIIDGSIGIRYQNAKFPRIVEVHTSLALFLLVVLFRRHVNRSLIIVVMWVEVFGFYLRLQLDVSSVA